MPKLRKEVEDKIIELLDQGYKNVEISEKTGIHRKTIASRRKAWKNRKQEPEKSEPEKSESEKVEPVQQEQTDSHPLDPQINMLIRYQGTNSGEEAIQQAIEIQKSFNPYVLNHGFETPKELIKFFEDKSQIELDKINDLKISNNINQALIVDYKETITQLKDEDDAHYDEGYEDGKNEQALVVPCTSCDEPITILPGTEAHVLIARFLRENYGIRHPDCKPRYQRIYAT